MSGTSQNIIVAPVEPRYNEWLIATGMTRFRYIEVLLILIVCYYWGKEELSLYRGLRYIEVRYIEVAL